MVALESRFSGLVNKVGDMEASQDAIVGLMGLIFGVLLAHLIFTICRELRKREWEREMEERLGFGEQPRAESSRIVGQGQEDRWDRTLGMVENMVALQSSQIGKSLEIKDKPIVERYNGKGEVMKWIRKIKRALKQIVGSEEDRIRFVLNHMEGKAAERTFNMRQSWESVEEIFEDLKKVYGRKLSSWEILAYMGARKQEDGETVWEFLDAIVEISELAEQGEIMKDRTIGECMAKNLRIPALGLKLHNRIRDRPGGKLGEWIEYIAEKEQEWKAFMIKEVSGNESERKEQWKGGESIKRSYGRYENVRRCYVCDGVDHVAKDCPIRVKHKTLTQQEKKAGNDGMERQEN